MSFRPKSSERGVHTMPATRCPEQSSERTNPPRKRRPVSGDVLCIVANQTELNHDYSIPDLNFRKKNFRKFFCHFRFSTSIGGQGPLAIGTVDKAARIALIAVRLLFSTSRTVHWSTMVRFYNFSLKIWNLIGNLAAEVWLLRDEGVSEEDTGHEGNHADSHAVSQELKNSDSERKALRKSAS